MSVCVQWPSFSINVESTSCPNFSIHLSKRTLCMTLAKASFFGPRQGSSFTTRLAETRFLAAETSVFSSQYALLCLLSTETWSVGFNYSCQTTHSTVARIRVSPSDQSKDRTECVPMISREVPNENMRLDMSEQCHGLVKYNFNISSMDNVAQYHKERRR